MNNLQATEVIKNVENKLEGLQVTVGKNLVNVKPMSDLSNWDTTGYETYLKNQAQELPENIKTRKEGVRANSIYLKILGATSNHCIGCVSGIELQLCQRDRAICMKRYELMFSFLIFCFRSMQ